MSYGLNFLKGGVYGTITGVVKGDTLSLDYGPYISRATMRVHLSFETTLWEFDFLLGA